MVPEPSHGGACRRRAHELPVLRAAGLLAFRRALRGGQRRLALAERPPRLAVPAARGDERHGGARRRYGAGWLGGIEAPEQVAPVIAAIREAAAAAGRPIDPDHYGASFSYRFGTWDEPIVQRTAQVLARLGRGADPHRLAVAGAARDIV